jgi:hypothetical protein
MTKSSSGDASPEGGSRRLIGAVTPHSPSPSGAPSPLDVEDEHASILETFDDAGAPAAGNEVVGILADLQGAEHLALVLAAEVVAQVGWSAGGTSSTRASRTSWAKLHGSSIQVKYVRRWVLPSRSSLAMVTVS